MSSLERTILAIISAFGFAGSIYSFTLFMDYYFGTGYGLIGWLSIPLTLMCAHVFAYAGAVASTGSYDLTR